MINVQVGMYMEESKFTLRNEDEEKSELKKWRRVVWKNNRQILEENK